MGIYFVCGNFCFYLFNSIYIFINMVLKLVEDIVVVGLVCRFLEFDNVEEFWFYMINKEDMVIEDDCCWMFGFYGFFK